MKKKRVLLFPHWDSYVITLNIDPWLALSFDLQAKIPTNAHNTENDQIAVIIFDTLDAVNNDECLNG